MPVSLLPGRTEALPGDTRTLVVAVPDQAIGTVAERLAASGASLPRIALHLSGALDASALETLRARGAAVGSCHPLQTFPDAEVPPDAFEGITFGLEGDAPAVAAGRALASVLGARSVAVPAGAKALWHLAAVLAGNGTIALVGAALDAMRAAGLGDEDALLALGPLARRSLEGALGVGPAAALTGPVARGDEATLERHRAAIAAWDPSRLALYEALVAEQRRLVARREAAKMPSPGSGTGC